MKQPAHIPIALFFQKIHPVDPEVLSTYLSHWKPFEAPKKTLLPREGQTERYMYYVLEGLQKSYYVNEGKIHVIAFTYPPSFSGMPESFISQQPSRYFLETMTDSKFLRIGYDKHQELLKEHREIETLFRIGTEKLLIGMLERYYELMAYDIKTRFTSFAKRSPHLFQMVPHKDLASYLRIDPTNFSKLMGTVRI